MQFKNNSTIQTLELPNEILSGLRTFTISIWVKMTKSEPYAAIFSAANSVNSNHVLITTTHIATNSKVVYHNPGIN